MNKCGQKTFILWQVDVGIAGEMEVPQQLIKSERPSNVKLDGALTNTSLGSRQPF